MTSLGNRSAFIRAAASLAPTTSWWWNETPPPGSNRRVLGLPMSCSSAARRSTRSGCPRLLQLDRLLEHGQGVLVDVLVPVVLVDLQAQPRQLGQHLLGEPGLAPAAQADPRPRGQDQLGQLVPDPLGGDDLDPVGHPRHRLDDRGVDREAELGGEPGGTQHPQRIVAERVLRPARSAQQRLDRSASPPYGSTNVVLGQRHGHRVDREVATLPGRPPACRRRSPRACATRCGRPRCGRW